MKAYAKVTKNNKSIRLSIDKNIVDLLDMTNTTDDERWEIEIIRKVSKKQIQEEMLKNIPEQR